MALTKCDVLRIRCRHDTYAYLVFFMGFKDINIIYIHVYI